MKVYISGPMTGMPDFNRPAFDRAASDVRAAGHEPVLPVPYVDGKKYAEYMRDDIRMMLDCDAVLMLPGWGKSRGASFEWSVAEMCGIRTVLSVRYL